ncbi:MAG TPA: hypothetical protein VM864_08110 [Pyrinomonadaceae bacterium]|jgi:hypothetical protein|nr:hypothetical protein [Pyrinomonadaceae bacterium]
MNLKHSAIIFFCLLALLPAAAAAQVSPPAAPTDDQPDAEQQARRAALEGKALELLDDVGGEAQGLKLAENRVRLQVAAADLLWARDEKRARELFNAALTSVASAAAAIAPDDPRRGQLVQETMNLRREIAQTIAQRDPQLALDFVRGTRPPVPPGAPEKSYYQPDQEIMLETSLAEQVAARDPKQALRIAEEVLARGLSGQLANVLERVRAADPEAASKLAADVVRKIRAANLATNVEATNLASYLLQVSRPAEFISARGGGAPDPRRAALLDDQTRRDLLTSMINAALSASSDARARGAEQRLVGALQQFMPEIERLNPVQAQALRRKAEAQPARNTFEAQARQQREYQGLMQTGTVDAILDAAAKATSPEMRQQLYQAAAWKAFNEGATERARQIAGERFDNPQQRAQFLHDLDQQMFWRAAGAGDIELARSIIPRLARAEERTQLLAQLARIVAAKGDKEGAARLLEEVWNQIGGRAKSQQQFSAQLEAAQVFAQVAPDRAFEIVEASISQLNEMVAAAEVVDGFGQDAFEQDELKAQGGWVWTSLVRQCGDTLGALARADFERAVSAADRLQRPETRLVARLAVARGVLSPAGDPMLRQRAPRGGLRTVIRN